VSRHGIFHWERNDQIIAAPASVVDSDCGGGKRGDWNVPEDKGTRLVNGKTHQWYHLWQENDNAIRAIIEPVCLAPHVSDTCFCNLSTDNFATPSTPLPMDNTKAPWKKVTASTDEYSSIKTSVYFGSGSCGGGCTSGTPVPVDTMLNAIQSVVWETVEGLESGGAIKLGDNPNDDGKCCFPEKDAPNGTLHNEINIKVMLNAAIPPPMKGTLHLAWFDPDNPIGSLVEPTTNGDGTRDNYGSITLAPTTLEFTSADNGVKYALMYVR